jgi:hypothetical protein
VRTRSWPTSLITTSVILALAAPAQAGTIRLHTTPPSSSNRYDQGTASLEFTALPGERNDIVVERVPGRGVRLTDLGAPTTGCPADGPNAVLCPNDVPMSVATGDGDDRVVVASAYSGSVSGGAGNDHLTALEAAYLDGDDGDDLLEGSPQDDDLIGGAGHDRIRGGAGDDRIREDDRDADRIDGGLGRDEVDYYEDDKGIRVDLSRDRGPHGDVLAGIEDAEGGDGPDVLIGDDGANELRGGRGRDRIEGRGGADLLEGDAGRDVVLGGAGDDTLDGDDDDDLQSGPGDDRLLANVPGGPRLRCGAGDDRVSLDIERGLPYISRDCETVEGPGPTLRVTRSRLILRWNSADYRRPCRIRAVVGTRATVLRHFTGASLPARGELRVRLTPTSRCKGAFGDGYTPTVFRLGP